MYSNRARDVPTYRRCFLQEPNDALLILQAVINERLPLTQRRPNDATRDKLIKSGNVFVMDIKQGPISRWTDGLSWSPSRILGAYLLYREKKPCRSLYKRNTSFKEHSSSHSSSHRGRSNGVNGSAGYDNYHDGRHDIAGAVSPYNQSPTEHNLYGSLTSNEHYKEDGLLKKTITIAYKGSLFRIVGYYLPQDVEEKRLITPSSDPEFEDIVLDPELQDRNNIKMPIAVPTDVPLDPIYGVPIVPKASSNYSYNPMATPVNSAYQEVPLTRNYGGAMCEPVSMAARPATYGGGGVSIYPNIFASQPSYMDSRYMGSKQQYPAAYGQGLGIQPLVDFPHHSYYPAASHLPVPNGGQHLASPETPRSMVTQYTPAFQGDAWNNGAMAGSRPREYGNTLPANYNPNEANVKHETLPRIRTTLDGINTGSPTNAPNMTTPPNDPSSALQTAASELVNMQNGSAYDPALHSGGTSSVAAGSKGGFSASKIAETANFEPSLVREETRAKSKGTAATGAATATSTTTTQAAYDSKNGKACHESSASNTGIALNLNYRQAAPVTSNGSFVADRY